MNVFGIRIANTVFEFADTLMMPRKGEKRLIPFSKITNWTARNTVRDYVPDLIFYSINAIAYERAPLTDIPLLYLWRSETIKTILPHESPKLLN